MALDKHSRVCRRVWVIALAVEANTHGERIPGGIGAGAVADR
eukprot:COSAG06_NODE_42557_length_380_cov_1.409253_2_plen_41_part_01